MKIKFFLLSCSLSGIIQSSAQQGKKALDTVPRTSTLPEVSITAGGVRHKVKGMESTVQVIGRKEIDNAGIRSLDQAMSRIAGAVSQDEDGRGLKPNYSLRGLDPERSSSVLTLVDGKIPSGTMYYGDPGGYYMLPLEQVERLEVIKGGATSVLFGGYTIGGVVNLVTRKSPVRPETRVELGYGSWNEWTAQVNTGARQGNFDYWINGYRRQGDGPRRSRSRFDVTDINARLGFQADSTTRLTIYLDGYGENSQTPGGLTQAQFDKDPRQVQNPFDEFVSRRFSAHISLDKQLRHGQFLNFAAYGNYFKRDWYVSRTDSTGAYTNVVGYVRDLPAGGLLVEYKWNGDIAGHENLFIAGSRMHADKYNNNTIKGYYPGAHTGLITGSKVTSTFVTEGYAYDKFHISNPWSVSGGLRFTNVSYSQDNYTSINPDNSIGRTDRTNIRALVYSLGTNYVFNDNYELFASFSRGFQPPLIYDVLDAATIDKGVILKPQYSWNYEVGTRLQPLSWLSMQVSAYYLDFRNKIIYDAKEGISRNIAGSGHRGLEMNLTTTSWKGMSVFLTGTWQEAKITKGEDKDHYLRYAPRHLLTAGLQYNHALAKGSLNTNISFHYVGKQFSDEANTNIASADGNNGPVPAYNYTNLQVNYEKNNWGLRFGINNLTDQKYFNRRWDFWGGIMPAPGINFHSSVFFRFG